MTTHSQGPAETQPAAATRLLQPGRNCWRIEPSPSVRLLQDAADYFATVRAAILSAQHSVFVLGWDIFAGLDLVPGAPDDGAPRHLAALLDFVVRRRRRLRCHVLVWDHSALYALERDPFTRVKLGWLTHRRVHFRFDDHHPLGGSHHEKIVVVDDRVAFAGSIDLTSHRWDTTAHAPEEPRRVTAMGQPYGPYHDVQLQVTGGAARALGELARDHWRRLGRRRLPRLRAPEGEAVPTVPADLRNARVGIARTEPAFHGRPAHRECEALYLDSIAAARRWIYIENQYFTDARIGAALAARLREIDGPEVVVVGPRQCDGWLERNTMGVLRETVLRELTAADRHGRLRLVYPLASRAADIATFVHSKLMLSDDELLRVGSANLARRSMGMDSECDLAVVAEDDPALRSGIRALACRLLAEHLGTSPATVEETWTRHGSLVHTVDALADGDRTLAPTRSGGAETAAASEGLRDLVDPNEPIGFVQQLGGALPELEAEHDRGRRLARALPFLVVAVALFTSWRFGGVPGRSLADVGAALEAAPTSWVAFAATTGALLVAGLAFLPLQLLTVGAAVVLGGWRGAGAAAIASLLAAAVGYHLGAALGPQRLARWIGTRVYRLLRVVHRPGFAGIATLRLVPVMSATTMHLLSGAAKVPARTYWVGTVLGLVPAVGSACVVGALARRAWLWREPWTAVAAGVLALLLVGVMLRLRRTLLQQHVDRALEGHDERARFG